MKKYALLVGICLSQLSFGYGSKTKVFGGKDVNNGWYPWQVMINTSVNGKPYLCGGTLIASRWVLTAAHCVVKNNKKVAPGNIQVAFGDTNRSKLRQSLQSVAEVFVHEAYDGSNSAPADDIAVLKLSRAVSVSSVRLAADARWAKQINHRLKVMGWGLTENDKQARAVEDLQIVDLAVVDEAYCRNNFGGFFSHGQLCVGDLQGVKDSCNGDSGGPLFRGIGSDAVQYGLVSFGDAQCASKDKPAVYTDVANYLGWIKQQMGDDANQLNVVAESAEKLDIPHNLPVGDRALLIGVDRYYLGGALNLIGPAQDVENMRQLLISKFHFKPQEIMVLKGEQATANNIRRAVKEWLIAQSAPGADVWLYFSGHGAFLPDINGDERENNTLIDSPADETILPFDTDMLTEQKVGSGSVIYTANHILDDEINEWTKKLGNRELTVMFDSCHSGTATRSVTFAKSKSGTLAMKNWINQKIGNGTAVAPSIPTKGSVIPTKNYVEKVNNRNMVFWAAADASERARDSERGGFFTLAFIDGVNGAADKNRDGHISYAELYGFLKSHVQEQTPQLEIADDRWQESIFSRDIVAEPDDAAAELLSDDNPYGLDMTWLDANLRPVTSLRVCHDQVRDCPKYKLQITTQKDGFLLLYDLDVNGSLQQFIPNQRDQRIKDGVYLNAGQKYIVPIDFEMVDDVPSTLIGILLDPIERVNYDKIKYQFANQRSANEGFFHTAINRRDTIINERGESAKVSVKIKPYAAK